MRKSVWSSIFEVRLSVKSGSYLVTDPPWILRMCCFRWSGRQKYFPQRVHVKVYLDPSLPHSYLECRVREDRDLYSRPHMTHRNLSSLAETPSIIGLAVSIHGGFLHMGYPPLSLTGVEIHVHPWRITPRFALHSFLSLCLSPARLFTLSRTFTLLPSSIIHLVSPNFPLHGSAKKSERQWLFRSRFRLSTTNNGKMKARAKHVDDIRPRFKKLALKRRLRAVLKKSFLPLWSNVKSLHCNVTRYSKYDVNYRSCNHSQLAKYSNRIPTQ